MTYSLFWRSYSWSANICGCKKWLIYPPGQEKYLTDRLGNLAYDVTSDDTNDRCQFPDFEKASKPITVIQKEGEVIFVPRYCSAQQSIVTDPSLHTIPTGWLKNFKMCVTMFLTNKPCSHSPLSPHSLL